MYRVETTPEFDEDVGSLDRAIAQRIIRKVEWLAEHPETLPPTYLRFPPLSLLSCRDVSSNLIFMYNLLYFTKLAQNSYESRECNEMKGTVNLYG